MAQALQLCSCSCRQAITREGDLQQCRRCSSTNRQHAQLMKRCRQCAHKVPAASQARTASLHRKHLCVVNRSHPWQWWRQTCACISCEAHDRGSCLLACLLACRQAACTKSFFTHAHRSWGPFASTNPYSCSSASAEKGPYAMATSWPGSQCCVATTLKRSDHSSSSTSL